MRFRQAGTPVTFINTADRDRALAFYCETLGFEHRSQDEFGDFIALDGALLRLTALPGYQPQPYPVLGWDVTDVAAAGAALRERGVTFTVFEGMGQNTDGLWTSPDGKHRLLWFADPDGNVLMLSQT